MNKDWSGATDTAGRKLYPGAERGTEEPVALTQANGYTGNLGLPWQQASTEPPFDSLMFWALGPNWVWQELFDTPTVLAGERSREIAVIDSTPVGHDTFAGVLNANSTNLLPFAGHGGKMVMYQGYADPLIPSATAIDYYNAVLAADPNAATYLRLFMAPGTWHCGGGPGANAFGNLSGTLPPQPLDPADDVLGALIAWVEDGIAPTQVTATKYLNDTPSQGIAFQRPLCLYPALCQRPEDQRGQFHLRLIGAGHQPELRTALRPLTGHRQPGDFSRSNWIGKNLRFFAATGIFIRSMGRVGRMML
jgi:feruloyl esterase